MEKTTTFKIFTWLIVLFFAIALPSAFKLTAQIQTICIVVGFGIDKHEDGVEVSAQVVIPQSGGEYSQTQAIISNSGKTLAEAVSNLELQTGKKLGLAHCHVLIVSKDLCSESIVPHIDYLIRSDLMDNNSVLLYTSKTAKELLKASSQLNTSDLNNLHTITSFNTKQEASSRLSLIDFVNDYLSPTKTSIFSCIDPPENKESSDSQQGGASDQPNSTSPTSKEAPTLLNDGKSVVLYNGKKILDLSNEDMHCLNWLNIKIQTGIIKIDDVTDKTLNLNNAKISFSVYKKTLNFYPSIVDGCPVLNVDMNLDLTINRVENEDLTIASTGLNFLTNTVNEKITNLINNEVNKAQQIGIDNSIDILKTYNFFNKTINKEWKQYINGLTDKSDYIKNLKIYVNCHPRMRS